MQKKNLRDYGRPVDHEVLGPPTWEVVPDAPACPNCGGRLVRCTVRAKVPMLTAGVGTGTYMGCPCCPYASPCMYVSDKASPGKA